MAISRITISALGRLDQEGKITEVRYIPGAVTPTICRYKSVESYLLGKKTGEKVFHEAAEIAVEEMVSLAGHRWSGVNKQ